MIALTRLYCGRSFAHDPLRYGVPAGPEVRDPHHRWTTARARRPVVVWNITRTCNLRCIHCYTDSEARSYAGELTLDEMDAVLEDLSRYRIPALLLSGGEPLAHPRFWSIAGRARELGLRVVLSTNATLITPEVAGRLKDLGLVHVGASLDGIGETNNAFRGRPWAFERAVAGIRNCKRTGLKVSLRMTLTRHNVGDLDGVFRFVEAEDIERVCFYHLAYAGRGRNLLSDDCTPGETRAALDKILAQTRAWVEAGAARDVLTVDNHADGVYVYLRLLGEDPQRAQEARRLLEWNGGGANSSGVGVADIDFLGNVHADQFSMHHSLGNVRERPFSAIWEDTSDPVMAGMKDRLRLLKGRCGGCKHLKMCGGGLRVRAEFAYGDLWAPDPACYLSDEEIGYTPGPAEARWPPAGRSV